MAQNEYPSHVHASVHGKFREVPTFTAETAGFGVLMILLKRKYVTSRILRHSFGAGRPLGVPIPAAQPPYPTYISLAVAACCPVRRNCGRGRDLDS